MVGDRLNTDILFAKNIGANSVLVLTGITTRDDARVAEPNQKPDFICDSVANIPDLVKYINEKTK